MLTLSQQAANSGIAILTGLAGIVGQGNGETQRLVLVGKRELHQNP